ncbi:MAG: hypothetical protein C5B48_09020 [Candidatus Rokuibacteriota bacterium]|nr:MAG: hypothetical protein C5B48_09020 [Candidatus Rokubacteria bacterium]
MIATLVLAAPPASATFPGGNGKIAFTGPNGIYVMNSDGSDQTLLGDGRDPAWSPDGQKIAFVSDRDGNAEIYVMNADGTGVTRLTDDPGSEREPAWSPDGQKLVFGRVAPFDSDLWTMNADGTGQVRLTPQRPNSEYHPRWSPDGNWIAFSRDIGGGTLGVFTIHPDGTGQSQLTSPTQVAAGPDWSPDGFLISYVVSSGAQAGLWTMAPDGSDQARLSYLVPGDPAWSPDGTQFVGVRYDMATGSDQIANFGYNGQVPQTLASEGNNSRPDWQPINPPPPPPPLYARPKGASPMRVSLVPAFDECTAPNSSHGPPLAFGSCAPPAQSSPYLTVGTPDSNGEAAASTGSVVFQVKPGDVGMTASITDVRCRTADVATCDGGALSDYTGELEVTSSIRVTDRSNGRFGTEPATFDRFEFPIRVPCAATASSSGGTCAVTTTFDTVLPGAIAAGKRALWQLGEVQVRDGGQDGSASTDDYATFMVQGLFIP